MDGEEVLRIVIDGPAEPQGSVSAYVVWAKRAGTNKWKWVPARRSDGSIVVNVTTDNSDLKAWRQKVLTTAQASFGGVCEEGVGYTIEIVSYFRRPKAHFGTGRNAHLVKDRAPAHPLTTPDVDKLARAAIDGLFDTIWHNDSQVTDLISRKRYDPDADERCDIVVWRNVQQTAADLPVAERSRRREESGDLALWQ